MDWTQGVDCAGAIIDDEWVVTSEECCMKLIGPVPIIIYRMNECSGS